MREQTGNGAGLGFIRRLPETDIVDNNTCTVHLWRPQKLLRWIFCYDTLDMGECGQGISELHHPTQLDLLLAIL